MWFVPCVWGATFEGVPCTCLPQGAENGVRAHWIRIPAFWRRLWRVRISGLGECEWVMPGTSLPSRLRVMARHAPGMQWALRKRLNNCIAKGLHQLALPLTSCVIWASYLTSLHFHCLICTMVSEEETVSRCKRSNYDSSWHLVGWGMYCCCYYGSIIDILLEYWLSGWLNNFQCFFYSKPRRRV